MWTELPPRVPAVSVARAFVSGLRDNEFGLVVLGSLTYTAHTVPKPNVGRLLSAETECLPKVLISPHSAPKPKP